MIVCQNCKAKEPDGTIFCSECGMQLLTSFAQTQKFSDERNLHQEDEKFAQAISGKNGTWISLYILETSHIIAFSERTEFTLGRVSENQPIEPDVDLTPYNAFDSGVSRLHAVIRQNGGNVILVDLASSNGTYINGIRIRPNVEQLLRHGDIVALGKLKIQIALS